MLCKKGVCICTLRVSLTSPKIEILKQQELNELNLCLFGLNNQSSNSRMTQTDTQSMWSHQYSGHLQTFWVSSSRSMIYIL